MQNILDNLYQGNNLNQKQFKKLFHSIMMKKLSSIQIAAALISMKIRGETLTEILESTNILINSSRSFPKPNDLFADITGTGGDGKNTINISTISSIVAATCNLKIIKHGNYNISSVTGSIDLLNQKNDISIESYENNAINDFNKFGICFLCVFKYYDLFRYVMPIRKQLKTPTLFNIIGPLINPAKPPLSLIGVYKKTLLPLVTQTLKLLKYHHHAIIVHCDGIDEVGLHAPTYVSELHDGIINNYILNPSDFGLNSYPIEELFCNSKQEAYNNMINIFKGKAKLSHISIIAANVALLMKLFGHEDLFFNTQLILEKIYQGESYKKFLSLLKESDK